MTLKQAAQQALDVQDACNGIAVVNSLARIMKILQESPDYTGTTWLNQHPIVYMFGYKLMALNGFEPLSDYEQYQKAEDECRRLAASEYAVIVGNIGQVYSGHDKDAAIAEYEEYTAQSASGIGRAGNEKVTLTCDGEPHREYFPANPNSPDES